MFSKNKKSNKSLPRRRQFDSTSSRSDNIEDNSNYMSGRTIIQGYRKNSDSLNRNASPRLNIHHLSIKRRKVSGIFIFSAITAIFTWLILINFTAQINIGVIDTSIVTSVDEGYYIDLINQYLDKNPLARFSFVINESDLDNYIKNIAPEVVKVSRGGNDSSLGITNFYFSFRKPVAGWKIGDVQYFVDSEGVSFSINRYESPQVRIIDNTGVDAQSGVAIASKRFLSYVGKVVSLFNESNNNVRQVLLPRNTTRELDLYFSEYSDMYVKMSIDRSVGEQVEDAIRSIEYFKKNNKMPQYIDVRVSGKAFYK